MYEGQQLKYGHVRGGEQGFGVTIKATQYIPAAGSKFVKRTGSGTATVTIATQTDSEILGHLECEALNSSDGTEVRKVITDPTAVYRVPIAGGTYAATMKGKVCDLVVSSGVQKAALNSKTTGQLIVEDGDTVGNSWVDVKINYTMVDGIRTAIA